MKYSNINGGNTMKRTATLLLLLIMSAGFIFAAPSIKIVTSYVSPYMWTQTPGMTADSTIFNGLRTAPKGTYVYFRAWNYGDAGTITSADWSFVSKPAGSNASLTAVTGLSWWSKFKIDSTGTYVINVHVVTSTGTKDTTETIYGATFVGTGNFDGVPAAYPNCMTCHAGNEPFQTIFNKWKVSGHANRFKTAITATGSTYSTSCMKCHTVGYDQTLVAENGGFDDRARQLGWIWANYNPPKASNWDSLKNRFPSLVAFASIGCESCHGPGSEHVLGGGDTNKIQRSVDEGVCLKCHDSPQNHPIGRQWANAKHSSVVYSSSFAQQNNGTNNLGNCIRCHDGQGYVNFTKGIGTNTNTYNQGKQEMVACASCHDPHGDNGIGYQLRSRPTGSDTLGNGFHYTGVGTGIVCLDCHKSRYSGPATVLTRITNSRWGPHENPQADVYLAQNCVPLPGYPTFRSTAHKDFLTNACVTCHMAPTDTSSTSGNRNKVGGHALYLHNDSTDYDHLEACKTCHAGKTRFDQFIADQDYDGDGITEPWRKEIDGCDSLLRVELPPRGIDSVSWQLISADSNNVTLRKAYWNWMVIERGSERGMHNPKYSIDVLRYSRMAIIGIMPISNEVPMRFELSQNYPNPFNPTTNINFSVAKTDNVVIKIYDIMGREVKTLVNQNMTAGKYKVDWTSVNNEGKSVSSGVYFYRMISGNFTDVKKMILVR
jgi:hypothetical protein